VVSNQTSKEVFLVLLRLNQKLLLLGRENFDLSLTQGKIGKGISMRTKINEVSRWNSNNDLNDRIQILHSLGCHFCSIETETCKQTSSVSIDHRHLGINICFENDQ